MTRSNNQELPRQSARVKGKQDEGASRRKVPVPDHPMKMNKQTSLTSNKSSKRLSKKDTPSESTALKPRLRKISSKENQPTREDSSMVVDQLANADSSKQLDSLDLTKLKPKSETQFQITKAPDGGEIRERVYRTERNGKVLERDYKNEREFAEGKGKSKVYSSYREYRGEGDQEEMKEIWGEKDPNSSPRDPFPDQIRDLVRPQTSLFGTDLLPPKRPLRSANQPIRLNGAAVPRHEEGLRNDAEASRPRV
eukprot:CAMPEP_0168608344 /NCGR_PEP_ID=MMETSP0449_2-20121227/574_1 /TAXON_ID=1082188 /ORGANISM="Strombidium rassoulzadegani, Strain ras09" /LENGTH=251 /DNA_ID=CAMNT_0008648317 /DNA_START=82 /DNA_END=836 /DNA_ORIENTATION=+